MKKDRQEISAKSAKREIKAKIRKRLIKVFKSITAELGLDTENPPFDLEKTARKMSKKMAKHAVLQTPSEQSSPQGGSPEQKVAIPAARKPRATRKVAEGSAALTKTRRTRKPSAALATSASRPAPKTESTANGVPVEKKQRRPRTVKAKSSTSARPKTAPASAATQTGQPSGGEAQGGSAAGPARTGAKRGRKPRSGPPAETQQ